MVKLIIIQMMTGVVAWAGSAVAAGCTDMHPGPNPLTVTSGGKEQRLNLLLPASFQPGKRVPLIIGLHPSGGSGEAFDRDTGLSTNAIAKGFAVLVPDGGVKLPTSEGSWWNIPGVPLVGGETVPAEARDDVRFIADTIDHVVKNSCVDARRIYVTGFSGGARMSSLIGCRLADRVAAVAPIAGLRAGRATGPELAEPDAEDCKPSQPLPVLAVHGADDATNPFPGGGGVRWGYSVERAAARWASLSHCSATPAIRQISPQVTRVHYGSCGDGGEVVLYRIDAPGDQGGGHVWPGGRHDLSARTPPAELNATEVVLQFFGRH